MRKTDIGITNVAPRQREPEKRPIKRRATRELNELYEVRIVEEYVCAALEALRRKDFVFTVGSDFEQFAMLWRSLAGKEELNRVFDINCGHLTPDISFWATIERNGVCLATAASRCYETRNLRRLMASRQFFSTKHPIMARGYLDGLSARFPSLCGRLAYQGSFFAVPELRGTGVATLLGRVTRMLSIRFFDPDWLIGNCWRGIASSSLPLGAYAYTRIVPCLTSQGLARTGEDQFYLMWSSASEMISRLAREIPE